MGFLYLLGKLFYFKILIQGSGDIHSGNLRKIGFLEYITLKKAIKIAKRLRIFQFFSVCFSVFVYKISIKIIRTHLRSIMDFLDSKISPSKFFGCCPANSSNWMGLENCFYMKRNYRKIFIGFNVGFNRFKNRIVKVS